MGNRRLSLPQERLAEISDHVVESTATRLGIALADFTPEMRNAVLESVQSAFELQFSDSVVAAARAGVEDIVTQREPGPGLRERIAGQLVVGKDIATMITSDTAYLELLAKNATMLWSKYQALLMAGFSEEQAFRLIEAEIYAKGGPRAGR